MCRPDCQVCGIRLKPGQKKKTALLVKRGWLQVFAKKNRKRRRRCPARAKAERAKKWTDEKRELLYSGTVTATKPRVSSRTRRAPPTRLKRRTAGPPKTGGGKEENRVFLPRGHELSPRRQASILGKKKRRKEKGEGVPFPPRGLDGRSRPRPRQRKKSMPLSTSMRKV